MICRSASRKNKISTGKGRHFAGLFTYEYKNGFFVRHLKCAVHHSQVVVRQNVEFSFGSYPSLFINLQKETSILTKFIIKTITI